MATQQMWHDANERRKKTGTMSIRKWIPPSRRNLTTKNLPPALLVSSTTTTENQLSTGTYFAVSLERCTDCLDGTIALVFPSSFSRLRCCPGTLNLCSVLF